MKRFYFLLVALCCGASAAEIPLANLAPEKVPPTDVQIAHMNLPQALVTKPGEQLELVVPEGQVRLDGFVGRVAGDPKTGPGAFEARITVNGAVRFDTGPLPIHVWRRGIRFRIPVVAGDKVALTSSATDVPDDLRIAWGKARFVDAASAAWPMPTANTNGIAPTPPMGWNNWYSLQKAIDEKVLLDTAQRLTDLGLRDAGYKIIGLDDGWQDDAKLRNKDGTPRYDAKKFPNGIRALSDKLAWRGFRLGIYSRPAWIGPGNEAVAARTFASWKIDLIKYDFSDKDGRDTNERMLRALRGAGSKAIFNVCEWGVNRPWEWGRAIGAQTWRTGFDVNFEGLFENDGENFIGVYTAAERNDIAAEFAGPGHWNDPDYLQVGFKGMNPEEWRSNFSLWCLMASPLTITTDLRTISPEAVKILSNKEAIAINQDPRGQQGVMVMRIGTSEAWAKPLADGSLAVGLLNRGKETDTVSCDFSFLGLKTPQRVRDLWEGRDLGVQSAEISARLARNAMTLYRLSPVAPAEDGGVGARRRLH